MFDFIFHLAYNKIAKFYQKTTFYLRQPTAMKRGDNVNAIENANIAKKKYSIYRVNGKNKAKAERKKQENENIGNINTQRANKADELIKTTRE